MKAFTFMIPMRAKEPVELRVEANDEQEARQLAVAAMRRMSIGDIHAQMRMETRRVDMMIPVASVEDNITVPKRKLAKVGDFRTFYYDDLCGNVDQVIAKINEHKKEILDQYPDAENISIDLDMDRYGEDRSINARFTFLRYESTLEHDLSAKKEEARKQAQRERDEAEFEALKKRLGK